MEHKKGIAWTMEELKEIYGERVTVPAPYHAEKIIYMKNGCCADLPVILTTNKRDDGSLNYSCQCACNGWCTTGCDTEAEALCHYERMTDGEDLYTPRIL